MLVKDSFSEIDYKIGRRLRAFRRLQGRTLTEISVEIGISFQSVQKYELGIVSMSMNRFLQVCSAYRVKPEAVLSGIVIDQSTEKAA